MASVAEKSPRRPVIFLAEEDQDEIYSFEQALVDIEDGHALRIARHGQQLFDLLETVKPQKPDMVFLDINTPSRNGFECLRLLRRLYGPKLPVFFLSTNSDKNALEDARHDGATGYLFKPISSNRMRRLLRSLLSINWWDRSPDDFYLNFENI